MPSRRANARLTSSTSSVSSPLRIRCAGGSRSVLRQVQQQRSQQVGEHHRDRPPIRVWPGSQSVGRSAYVDLDVVDGRVLDGRGHALMVIVERQNRPYPSTRRGDREHARAAPRSSSPDRSTSVPPTPTPASAPALLDQATAPGTAAWSHGRRCRTPVRDRSRSPADRGDRSGSPTAPHAQCSHTLRHGGSTVTGR